MIFFFSLVYFLAVDVKNRVQPWVFFSSSVAVSQFSKSQQLYFYVQWQDYAKRHTGMVRYCVTTEMIFTCTWCFQKTRERMSSLYFQDEVFGLFFSCISVIITTGIFSFVKVQITYNVRRFKLLHCNTDVCKWASCLMQSDLNVCIYHYNNWVCILVKLIK